MTTEETAEGGSVAPIDTTPARPSYEALQAEIERLRQDQTDINRAWAKLLFAEQNGGTRAYESAARGLQDVGVDLDALMGAL